MAFFDNLWNFGGSVVGSLAKVAALGYVSRLLSDNTNESSTGKPEVVDQGVRLQLNPSTENKIPILYGEAYFGGYITDARLSSNYKTMTYCLTLAETTGAKLSGGSSSYTFNGVYFNNNRVVFKADGITVDYTLDAAGNQDISARDLIKVYFYKEQTGIQPSGSGGTTPAPSSVMPGWTSGTHAMTGLLYAIVEVTYSRDKGISGLPDCTFHVTNSMTLPGDVLYDYMTNSQYGANIASTELDSSFVSLNSYATAGFSYRTPAGTTTSGIVAINGLIDTNTVVLTNIEEIAKAAGSWISYDIHAGQWIVVINQAGTSVASFDDSNMIGEISISGTSLTQLDNVANVKYQNTDILDKTDFVKISIPEEDLFQNEPRGSLELSLPFTNQQAVAAKLGLLLLKQARVDKIISFKSDYSYLNIRAGDLIDVTSAVYGFTNKVFRVINIEETENDTGELVLQYKALEYDPDVYVYDIQEYLVETDDGILGIGSIGKPDTPTVTKTEQANVPKIVINAEVPSGIVDAIEFWLTFDVGVSNDSARTYIQIGTYTNPTGTTLTENQAVSYTYSGLSQSDFFVKVRGVNSVATGPYSDPTGLIQYIPIVVADTVSNNPVLGLDNQLMSLGLLALLNNLDGLYKGLFGSGSLVDKIMDGIKSATGVDLKDGATITETVYVDPNPVCLLSFGANKYPLDRSTGENPETPYPNDVPLGPKDPNKVRLSGTIADYADPNGFYYFSIAENVELVKGTGSIKLYKSDGTLVETLTGNAVEIDPVNKIVKIPFAARANKTDYYIIMEAGVVKSAAGCVSPAIDDPLVWNFHTDTPSPRPVIVPPPSTPTPTSCPPLLPTRVITKYYRDAIAPDNLKVDIETNIKLVFNQGIKLQTAGTITIQSSGGSFQTFDLSKTYPNNKISTEMVYAEGPNLVVNPTTDFAYGTTYWITVSANCVTNDCGQGNAAIAGNTYTWTTDSGPVGGNPTQPGSNTALNQSTTEIKYDRPIDRSTASIDIKNPAGTVVKSVPASSPAVSIKEG